jgi:hypothetical protein
MVHLRYKVFQSRRYTVFGILLCTCHGLQAQEQNELIITLIQRVDQLETRLQTVEDVAAIKDLQRIYGYYVDKGLSTQVADLFSEDATLEIAGRGLYRGIDQIRRYMNSLPQLAHGLLFDHMQLQPVIHINQDGKTAKGRLRALVQNGVYGETAIWGAGVYENEYIKDDGVWKISKLHFYTTFYANYADSWSSNAIPLFGPLPELPPDEPPTVKYESYPGVYIPPFHYKNPVSGK